MTGRVKNIHLNTRTQGSPIQHHPVTVINTIAPPVSGFNGAADNKLSESGQTYCLPVVSHYFLPTERSTSRTKLWQVMCEYKNV